MSVSSKNIAAGLTKQVEMIGSLDSLVTCCQVLNYFTICSSYYCCKY